MCTSRCSRWARSGLLLLVGVLALNACNLPQRDSNQSAVGAIYTQAAQTVQAQMTEISGPPPTGAGFTPAPGNTPQPPAPTSAPTSAPGAAPTAAPTTAATAASACDRAKFVQDVTVPDGTDLAPGASFVKTWRLQNAGTCTWTSAYQVVFSGGDGMGAPPSLPLTTGTVAPGETVEISANLKAPDAVGSYRGDFLLSNAAGQRFGTGEDGTKPFWAQIDVVVASGIVYDFLVRAPEAAWFSGAGDNVTTPLAFNGAEDNPAGVARIKEGVTLETGAISGKLLLAVPRQEKNGVVMGVYPAYTVQSGDHVKARLGFLLPSGSGCGEGSVIFQILAKVGDQTSTLGEWEKACTGALSPVDVDLSSLAGKSVQIVFVVRANGVAQDDWAIWNSPRIQH